MAVSQAMLKKANVKFANFDNSKAITDFEKEETVQIGNAYFTRVLSDLQLKNRTILMAMYEISPKVADLFRILGLQVIEGEIETIKKAVPSTTPNERAAALALKIIGSEIGSMPKSQFIKMVKQFTNCDESKALNGVNFMLTNGIIKSCEVPCNSVLIGYNEWLNLGYQEFFYIKHVF